MPYNIMKIITIIKTTTPRTVKIFAVNLGLTAKPVITPNRIVPYPKNIRIMNGNKNRRPMKTTRNTVKWISPLYLMLINT